VTRPMAHMKTALMDCTMKRNQRATLDTTMATQDDVVVASTSRAFKISKTVANNVFHNDIFQGVNNLRRQLMRQHAERNARPSLTLWYASSELVSALCTAELFEWVQASVVS
jgi:hypothetical protein